MTKFSFQKPLKSILYLQALRSNKEMYTKVIGQTFTGGHPGNDINFGDKQPVFNLMQGVVIYTQQDTIVVLGDADSQGNCLEINYAHMERQQVKVGDRVKVGDILGYQDSMGSSIFRDDTQKVSWSHLHLGIREAKLGTKIPKNYFWNYQAFSSIPYNVIEYDETIEHFRDPNNYCQQVVYLIAKAIERKENYKKYHKDTNNPGNIRGVDGKFLRFKTYEEGFEHLVNYLINAVNGKHKSYTKAKTILDFINIYAPSYDNNNSLKYAQDIVKWVGLNSINDSIKDWLLTELEWIRKYNNAEQIIYPKQYGEKDSQTNQVIPAVEISLFNALSERFKWLWSKLFGK